MNILVDCVQTGSIVLKHVDVDLVVTLRPWTAWRHKLSGYVNHAKYCRKKKIRVYYPQKFDLSGKRDLKMFQKWKPDLLMVFGWQRIIPDEIIKTAKVAVGNHGSWKYLPFGRGHSPINWALIKDKKKFYSHLFYLEPGVDSGDIIDVKKFPINTQDTCDSLYKKNGMMLSSMLQTNWDNIKNRKPGIKQLGVPTYLPKRIPEDGLLTIDMSTKQMYNKVRALAKPYPGAFIENKSKHIIRIWKASPFGLNFNKRKAGEIYQFQDGQILLFTKDSSLLITEWSLEHKGGRNNG